MVFSIESTHIHIQILKFFNRVSPSKFSLLLQTLRGSWGWCTVKCTINVTSLLLLLCAGHLDTVLSPLHGLSQLHFTYNWFSFCNEAWDLHHLSLWHLEGPILNLQISFPYCIDFYILILWEHESCLCIHLVTHGFTLTRKPVGDESGWPV